MFLVLVLKYISSTNKIVFLDISLPPSILTLTLVLIICPSRAAVTLGFGELGCSSQPPDSNLAVGSCGPDNRGTEVNIGFDTRVGEEGVETVTLTVCYDVAASVNIWSRHSLWDEINARWGRGEEQPLLHS